MCVKWKLMPFFKFSNKMGGSVSLCPQLLACTWSKWKCLSSTIPRNQLRRGKNIYTMFTKDVCTRVPCQSTKELHVKQSASVEFPVHLSGRYLKKIKCNLCLLECTVGYLDMRVNLAGFVHLSCSRRQTEPDCNDKPVSLFPNGLQSNSFNIVGKL